MTSRSTSQRVKTILAAIGALALLIAVLGLGALLMMVRRGFRAQDEPTQIERVMARAMRGWSVPTAMKQRKNPVSANEGTLTAARAHWADHCAICHANDGSGRTTLGSGMYPHAPDMRTSDTQKLSDGELFSIIQNGIRLTGMPGWASGDAHDESESWALVTFIRHLPELRPDELREMEQLNPRSPAEHQEEAEEDKFLSGETPAPTEKGNPHHGKE